MSFLSSFKAAFEKLFHTAPAWEHTAITVVEFAAPIAESAIALYAPELLPVALPIIARVKSGLATLYAMTGDGSSPQNVITVIQNIQSNLTDLLAVSGIKDDATVTKITASVNLVSDELTGILTMLGAAPKVAAAPVAS